ncbi:MAG: hypothetical protein JWM86_136 [Thermoleophilia bacterium]|nr:hypothetical protein [Thermoleophilia bacterium]
MGGRAGPAGTLVGTMTDDPRPPKDLYGRKATSQSRGRTIERIMDKQHPQGMIPGADEVLADRPAGSIADAICRFHEAWVEPKAVTTRRAYERSLAFFARDLAETGPAPTESVAVLTQGRILAHMDWRRSKGLDDPGELQRSAMHLVRLLEWSRDELGAALEVDRVWVRAEATARAADAPPPFHLATSADELRDTSGDAALLDD